ncbi:MAG: hypothetical protein KGY53_10655 [Wenzhouxiangellaceae bacterium]|jgi:hypothetical protein|nr:hypothetical protein [Wenzhouxiangellaceae bacterium]MBS3824342.1 hypothetical protein [Wenzhouxiangellaceae bacterium]
MTRCFLIPAAVAGALALLAGCATRTECGDARATARQAAQDRQPPGQWIGGVDAACTDEARQAWASALAEDCVPLHGFHAGLDGEQAAAACTGAAYQSALSLGRMLAEMRAEAAKIKRRLQEESLPADVRRDLQRRQVVIGRDLPQLEALARMDGYLPPAEVPGAER